MPDFYKLFEELNTDNFKKTTDQFSRKKGAYQLIEATPQQFILNNINSNLIIMAQEPGVIDRIINRIEKLKEQKEQSEEFLKHLNFENEDHLHIMAKESKELLKAEIMIEEYTKFLNDEN